MAKKDCTLCPFCGKSIFEAHQALARGVTAQNETNIEVRAFLHVLYEKMQKVD